MQSAGDIVDLSGAWQFGWQFGPVRSEYKTAGEVASAMEVRPANVPGNLELDLQANGLIDEPFRQTANQIRELFGVIPDNLEDFALGSQASQAEAKKFFIEFFRTSKWRRTGIIWWNLMDGWPQISDAVVDYYFERKLAYQTIKRSQQPVCLMLREATGWYQDLVAANDTREDAEVRYTVRDVDTGQVLLEGQRIATADAVTQLGKVPYSAAEKRFYLIEWDGPAGKGVNHYMAGNPPFELAAYKRWLEKAGL